MVTGDRGARPQHTGGPYSGFRLTHIHVQQLGQQPGRPTGQQLRRRAAALQLGDQPVIHRRHPPPLRLQVLEHGKYFVVIEPIQRLRLQHVDHPGQLGERSTHGTGHRRVLPVERRNRTYERIIATYADTFSRRRAAIGCDLLAL